MFRSTPVSLAGPRFVCFVFILSKKNTLLTSLWTVYECVESRLLKNSVGSSCAQLGGYLALLRWVELPAGLGVAVSLEGTPDTMRKMTTEQKEVARTSGLDPAAGTKASGPDVEGKLASRH